MSRSAGCTSTSASSIYSYGFVLSIAIYYTLNAIFPDRRSLIVKAVHGVPTVLENVVVDVDGEKDVLEYDQARVSKEVRSRECFVRSYFV